MMFRRKGFPCPTASLDVSENSLFAVNDSKGLIAIYEIGSCMVCGIAFFLYININIIV